MIYKALPKTQKHINTYHVFLNLGMLSSFTVSEEEYLYVTAQPLQNDANSQFIMSLED